MRGVQDALGENQKWIGMHAQKLDDARRSLERVEGQLVTGEKIGKLSAGNGCTGHPGQTGSHLGQPMFCVVQGECPAALSLFSHPDFRRGFPLEIVVDFA